MIGDIPLEAVETLSPDALAALQREKLAALVKRAQNHSPFYRDHLKGIDADAAFDLEAIPPLTKDLLVQNSPPVSDALLTGPLAGAYVLRSGGTTGSPKFSAFSNDEFRQVTDLFKRTYGAAGLRSSDWVGNLFVAGSLYSSFVFINRVIEEMNCVNFPFTGNAPAETVAQNMGRFSINTLMGIPSWVLEVVQKLPEEVLPKIQKIFYGGEHLYVEERTWLHDRLPNLQVIASGGYATVDTGLIGFQCPHGDGAVHHVHSDHVLFEVIDAATYQPLPEGEEGLVLVTELDRFLMPTIRYAVGDMARMVPGDCPCGRTFPRFELLGRNDDLRIGIATVAYDEVIRAVAELPELTTNVQLVKERDLMKDRLTVKVEARPGYTGDRADLAWRLRAAVLRHKPDLAKLIQTGHVLDLGVSVFDLGEIPRVPVTGKVKRTLDRSLNGLASS